MTTFLVICVVIILLTLPARVGARSRRRALERQAILRRLAGPRTIIVQMPTPRAASSRVDDGRLYWGPSGSNGVSS